MVSFSKLRTLVYVAWKESVMPVHEDLCIVNQDVLCGKLCLGTHYVSRGSGRITRLETSVLAMLVNKGCSCTWTCEELLRACAKPSRRSIQKSDGPFCLARLSDMAISRKG